LKKKELSNRISSKKKNFKRKFSSRTFWKEFLEGNSI
jgi:hypothetical protein